MVFLAALVKDFATYGGCLGLEACVRHCRHVSKLQTRLWVANDPLGVLCGIVGRRYQRGVETTSAVAR